MNDRGVDCLPDQARVAVYGYGARGKALMETMARIKPEARVVMFVDSFNEDKSESPPVLHVDNVLACGIEFDTLVVASSFYNDILDLLAVKGLMPDYFYHDNGLTNYPEGMYSPKFSFEKNRIRSFVSRFSGVDQQEAGGQCFYASCCTDMQE